MQPPLKPKDIHPQRTNNNKTRWRQNRIKSQTRLQHSEQLTITTSG